MTEFTSTPKGHENNECLYSAALLASSSQAQMKTPKRLKGTITAVTLSILAAFSLSSISSRGLAQETEQPSEVTVAPDLESEVSDDPLLETVNIELPIDKKIRAVSSSDGTHQLVNGPSAKYKPGVPCVPMMLVDDPNTLIVCDRDAGIKADKRNISLTHGKGVYMIGKQPVSVETPLGSITLAANSAAIIEQSENGLLRVDHLTGSPSTVSVKRWKGSKVFTACSGDEICLAPKGLARELLLPDDGIDRTAVSNETNDSGIVHLSNKFAPKKMLEKECLLECDSSSFFQVRRKVYMLRKTIDEQSKLSNCVGEESERPLLLLNGEESAESIVPVTLTEASQNSLPVRSQRRGSSVIKFNDKTEIDFSHPLVADLKNGEVLVSSADITFVRTPHSMVKVQPGAVVLIAVSDDVSKVRTIWENQKRSVSQSIGDKTFNVLAGDESLAAEGLRPIYLAASRDMVGRRLNHYSEVGDEHVIHFSEVSLMSLAQSSDLLSAMMNSSNNDDQSIMKKLNKMAAILVQISASHGMYELMQAPQWKREARSSQLPSAL